MNKVYLDWINFIQIALHVGNNIKRNYFDFDKIDILSLNDSLILSTVVQNYLGLAQKPISTEFCISPESKSFIIVSNVVSSGKYLRHVGDVLQKAGKKIEKVFCIYGSKDVPRETGIEIDTLMWKDSEDWITFCWEKDFYDRYAS